MDEELEFKWLDGVVDESTAKDLFDLLISVNPVDKSNEYWSLIEASQTYDHKLSYLVGIYCLPESYGSGCDFIRQICSIEGYDEDMIEELISRAHDTLWD